MQINELPNSEDAERNLIGLTLLNEKIPLTAREVATTDFYWPIYREAWSACLELEADGQPIEAIAVHALMSRNRPQIAAAYPVSSLSETFSGMANINERPIVRRIRETATRRHLIKKFNDAIQDLSNGGKGVVQSLRRELNELEYAEESKGNFVSLSSIIDNEIKPALVALRDGISQKISTGFPAIDRIIGGGITLSDVVLVAALPGCGKSAFVLQVAVNIAKQNIPVAFLSGEMSNKENGLRLLSQAAQVMNLNSAVYIPQVEYDFLVEWADEIKGLPIYFDTRTYDLRTLSHSLRSMVDNYGIKILVIDYIQLLKPDRSSKLQRTERVAEVSQEVRRIAMEFGIGIIEVPSSTARVRNQASRRCTILRPVHSSKKIRP
jgi:replicative DNA helicase